ncbi:hypothetical protein CRG98_010957, partial [Punica granatum]
EDRTLFLNDDIRADMVFSGASLDLILSTSLVPHLECLGQHLVRHSWAPREQGLHNGMPPWLPAVEHGEVRDSLGPVVLLEVGKIPREHEDLPSLHSLSYRFFEVVMNPTSSSPWSMNKILVAQGWVRGRFSPTRACSTRAIDTPKVFRPGIFSTSATVKLIPSELFTTAGFARSSKEKSNAVTLNSLFHAKPLTFGPCSAHC